MNFIAIILHFLVLPNFDFLHSPVLSEKMFLNSIKNSDQKIEIIDPGLLEVVLSSESAVAVDASSGLILYSKKSEEPRPIASITKLMTALVFLESDPDLSKVVTIQESDRHYGATPNIHIGESATLYDLLHASLVGSDNDATYVLARSSKYGIEGFIKKMNERAIALGMKNSNFVEPTGLSAKNTSTAKDLVYLLDEVSENKTIKAITSLPKYTMDVVDKNGKHRDEAIYATDKLTSSSYIDIIAGKTGYLPEAGYCLATKLNGLSKRDLYIIVLNSSDIDSRFSDVKSIEYYVNKKFFENKK